MSGPSLTHCRAMLGAHLRANSRSMALAGLASIGYAITELFSPWPLKVVLDYILLRKPLPQTLAPAAGWLRDQPELAIVCISSLIIVAAILKGAFSYLQTFITSRVGYELVHKLRQDLFSHLQRLSLAFHSRSRTGELLTKVTADTNVLKDVFAGGLLEVAGHILVLASTFTVLLALNWRLAAVAAATLPLLLFAIFTIYRRGKISARRQREREGAVAAHIGEMLHMTPLVRAFSMEQVEEKRFAEQNSQTLTESVRTARVEAAAGRTVEILNSVGVCAAVLFGGLLAHRGVITPGDLLVFVSYLTGMYKPLRNLAKLSTQFSKAMASAERIENLFATETESDHGGADPGKLSGSLEFRNVDFAYKADDPVLEGVSFRVSAGEHIALVGKSGAGKSTVASLILRFYRPSGGSILADGRDIAAFNLMQYRQQIGVVLQDTLLFGATVAENIAYGKPGAGRAEVEAAARMACAHEFISRLPQSYDTVLNERATTLSGGQRQRLSLARALLKDPAVLILDEPTASLDSESAGLIHDTIAGLRRGLTTIVIAHRFHNMERFDRILVVEDGCIAEQGTHDELMARRGVYTRLVRAHAAGKSVEVTQ